MPSEVIDRRRLSPLYAPSVPSSFLSDEIRVPMEKQIGFWKPSSASDHGDTERLPSMQGSGPVDLLDKEVRQFNVASAKSFEPQQLHFQGQKEKFNFQDLLGAKRINGHYDTPLQSTSCGLGPQFDTKVQPAKFHANWSKADLTNVNYENRPFSSSLSESLNKKVNLNSDDIFFGNSINIANSNFEEDETFESIKEMEAYTIGDLLPDDDDLLDYINQPSKSDDVEEDIFCTVGGIEIEEAVSSVSCDISQPMEDTSKLQEGEINSSFAGEHPSRTLFVRNINSNVEDTELRDLFQQYGDVRSLYTACKHRGFVMVSYYDIRSACNAMTALQNKPLGHRKLDIHFSIPKDHLSKKDINQGTLVVFNLESSVLNNDLCQIFGVYGEIKEIRELPEKRHHKFVTFYDVRAAEAALYALNGIEIAGKRIKLEHAHSGDVLHLKEQVTTQVEQNEICGFHLEAPAINSPTEGYGTTSFDAIKSSGIGLQAVHRLPSISQAPFNLFEDKTFNGLPSSGFHNFSPAKSAFVGNHTNQSAIVDLSHSPGERIFRFDHVPNFHPHSLPEHHDHMHQRIPHNAANSMSVTGINIARSAEHVDNRYTSVASSGFGSRSFQHPERATGALGNGSYPVHGQFGQNNNSMGSPSGPVVWAQNNNSMGSPSGPVVWAKSPPFLNSIPSPPLSQLHGFPRTSRMLNPAAHGLHHVGSAPAANPTLWNRHHAYAGDPTETSFFHPGSLGTMGFPGSPLNHVELVSHNILPHMGRNFMEPPVSSLHIGFPSTQQSCHIFNCRNDLMTVPAFDASSDRVRSRRNDINSAQADNKKQYELDIERIIRGEDGRTTLMIKNIPNKYTSKMLLAAIDEHHRGSYDFIYLPIDFKNKCNVGYAFINMINAQQIIPFHKTFNGKKWEKFNSEKVASLAYARIQGKAALIAHFQNSSLMNEDKRCRPILFHSDGPNAGDQEPFPIGGNTRARPGRSRNHNNDDYHHDVSLSSTIEEESSNGTMISSGARKDL